MPEVTSKYIVVSVVFFNSGLSLKAEVQNKSFLYAVGEINIFLGSERGSLNSCFHSTIYSRTYSLYANNTRSRSKIYGYQQIVTGWVSLIKYFH